MNNKAQRALCCTLLTLVALGAAMKLAAQEATVAESTPVSIQPTFTRTALPAALPNNFADVITIDYPSGLRVYLKPMPQVDNVYISAFLPVGSTHDPRRREGLAHFVEHMVYTDDNNRSEAEIRKDVTDRGGTMNASTTQYRTQYYIDLPADEWSFGLDWIQQRLAGHQFTALALEQERQAVLLEKSRGSNTLPIFDTINQAIVANRGLNDFWQKEFGLKRERRSIIGTDGSIGSITLEDIQGFYDRYYHPANVTLLVFGKVDSVQVRSALDAGFGQWNSTGEVIDVVKPVDTASRYKIGYDFSLKRSQGYTINWKLYELTAADVDRAEFLGAFLRQYLLDKLRVERKATYGSNVYFEPFAGHGRLVVDGSYATSEMEYAASVIDTAIEELKANSFDPLKFEDLRKRAVDALLLAFQTPLTLATRCNIYTICNKSLYQEFPDTVGQWRAFTSANLSEWMQRNIVQERRVDNVNSPSPLGLPVAFLLTLGAGVLAVRLRRRSWLQPLPMHTLRYFCKLKPPFGPLTWLKGLGAFALGIFTGSVFFTISRPAMQLTNSIDSVLVQSWYPILFAFGLTFLYLSARAQTPKKLLLFEREWRLKCTPWRTIRHEYGDIAELQEYSRKEVQEHAPRFGTRWWHDGFGGKGVYIKLKSGMAYYLRVRDNAELLNMLREGVARASPPQYAET